MTNILKYTLILGAGMGVGFIIGKEITKRDYEELIDHIEETHSQQFKNEKTASEEDGAYVQTAEETSASREAVLDVERRGNKIKARYEREANKYNTSIDKDTYEHEQMSKEANNHDKWVTPYVITTEEFAEEKNHYDKITMYFYEDDEVLTDENEEIVQDVIAIIGDAALENFGNGSDDPEVVYVRNDKLEIDYEIIRLSKSYAETVLGINYND